MRTISQFLLVVAILIAAAVLPLASVAFAQNYGPHGGAVPVYNQNEVEANKYVVRRETQVAPAMQTPNALRPLNGTPLEVQIALAVTGNYDGEIDGTLNQETIKAINEYYVRNPRNANASMLIDLRMAQSRLIAEGYYKGQVDGKANLALYNAYQRFLEGRPERTIELPSAIDNMDDGVLDQKPVEEAVMPAPQQQKPVEQAYVDPFGGDVPKAAPRDSVTRESLDQAPQKAPVEKTTTRRSGGYSI